MTRVLQSDHGAANAIAGLGLMARAFREMRDVKWNFTGTLSRFADF
jgi:hypothetical protein